MVAMVEEGNRASEVLAELQPTFKNLFEAMDKGRARFYEELLAKKEKKEEECPVWEKLKKQDKDMITWVKNELAKMCEEVKDRGQRGKMIRRIWKKARVKFKASEAIPEKWEDFAPRKDNFKYDGKDMLKDFQTYLDNIRKMNDSMIKDSIPSRGER